MSSGEAVLVPVAVVALAPVVAVGAVVTLAEAALLAHQRHRFDAQVQRATALNTRAARLRLKQQAVPGPPQATIKQTRDAADRLASANQQREYDLDQRQAQFDQLQRDLSAAWSRQETLVRWASEAVLGVAGVGILPSFPNHSAVEELRQQWQLTTESNEELTAALGAEHDRHETALAEKVWQAIEMTEVADVESDPLSTLSLTRRDLRGRLQRAVINYPLDTSLPEAIRKAAEAVEQTRDMDSATRQVDGAVRELKELHDLSTTVSNFLAALERVLIEAKEIEHNDIDDECRSLQNELRARESTQAAAEITSWVQEKRRILNERLTTARATYERELQGRAQRAQRLLHEQMCAVLAQTDHYVEVEVEVGLPRGGRLFVERRNRDYGKLVEITESGNVKSSSVRLGGPGNRATRREDETACKRQTEYDRTHVEPRLNAALRQRAAASDKSSLVEWTHDPAMDVGNIPVSDQDQEKIDALTRDHSHRQRKERTIDRGSLR